MILEYLIKVAEESTLDQQESSDEKLKNITHYLRNGLIIGSAAGLTKGLVDISRKNKLLKVPGISIDPVTGASVKTKMKVPAQYVSKGVKAKHVFNNALSGISTGAAAGLAAYLAKKILDNKKQQAEE
jgi:hypothetical protein